MKCIQWMHYEEVVYLLLSICLAFKIAKRISIKLNAVAYLVEALRYKSQGRGFDSQWGNLVFNLTEFFQPHYGPGVGSACNRNECQVSSCGKGEGRCIRLATTPPSVSRFFRKCEDFDVSKAHGPSRPVTWIALRLTFTRNLSQN
jgi:hypothetical protein